MFKRIEEFDEEIEALKSDILETEEYLKNHPEKLGTLGNYNTMKEIYEIYLKNRKKFIDTHCDLNLKLSGKQLNAPLSNSSLYSLLNTLYETNNSIIPNINENEEFLIKNVSEGSYTITFGFENPTEDDFTRKSSRRKALIKLFRYIDCKNDLVKLKNESGANGHESLLKYKLFLSEIIKNNADFILETENGNLKAGLTLEESENICRSLNI